ncbi:MAG: hypothetical protein ABI645_16990 [Pseudomonadota bacterium]
MRLNPGRDDVQGLVRLSTVLLLIVCLTCDAAGQLSFKQAASKVSASESNWQVRWRQFAAEPWIWAGIAFFVLEFFLWLAVLSLLPLSQGILLGSASTLVILIAGRVFFVERLGPMKVLGASLIALGVAVVGLG